MHELAEIIRDLLIFTAAMVVLLGGLVVIVSKLPDNNPLKRILSALSIRVGATLAAGVLAIPIEPIPGIDVLYDIGVPIGLVWFWYTFLRDTYRGPNASAKPSMRWAGGQTIDHEP